MADITISAVSTVYTGTDGNDSFRNTVGNPTDIGVLALSGNDVVTFGSATQSGTGAGGLGLGFGLASSDIQLQDGNDTFTFSGQIGSGAPRFNVNNIAGGSGEDYIRVNDVLSASGSVLRGGANYDQVYFIGNGGTVQTAFRTLMEGNQGDDEMSATWDGQAKNFEIYGGQGVDTISASFNRVTSFDAATAFVSGTYIAGGTGNDLINVDVYGNTAIDVVIAGNSGADTIGYNQTLAGGQSEAGFIFGGAGNDAISADLQGSVSGFQIQAGLGNDSASFAVGASSNDVLQNGAAGNDNLNFTALGSIGSATLRGGSGNDTISADLGVAATAGNVVISGESGADNISVSGAAAIFTGTVDAGLGADSVRLDLNGAVNGLGVFLRSGADTLSAGFAGAVSGFTADGNTGADLISISAAGTVTNSLIDGGHDSDTITAAFAGDLRGVNVLGGRGNDSATVNITNAGVSASAFSFNGQSGNDGLTFQVGNGNTFFAGNGSGGNNTIAGGTGTDTITLNLAGTLTASGASALIVSLGQEVTGGQINLNVGTAGSLSQQGATAGQAVGFQASTGNDAISFTVLGSGAAITGAVVSAEAGNDLFTMDASGAVVRTIVNAGDGADSITATFSTGVISGNVFNLDSGADSLAFFIATGENINGGAANGAFSAAGGLGNDTMKLTLFSGGRAALSAGNQLVGGSGADNLGLIGATASEFGGALAGASGADVITGNLASGSLLTGFTADGGLGNDTISFVFSAATTAGVALSGGSGAVFAGGSGADSINVVGAAVASANNNGFFNFGTIFGGSGVDSITFGGALVSTGEAASFSGTVVGGRGGDSITLSGNAIVSGGVALFSGTVFAIASGDSQADGFDTIFMANTNLTGGANNLAGTLGTAQITYSGYDSNVAGVWNNAVATTTVSGGAANVEALGQAIFLHQVGNGISAGARYGVGTGGVVAAFSADVDTATNGTFLLSGGSTLGEIFSAVGSLAPQRGTTIAFNVQNGSAGTIDGYVFTQAGVLTDTVTKFNGNGVAAGAFGAGDGYFRILRTNGLAGAVGGNASGGSIVFGENVGVG